MFIMTICAVCMVVDMIMITFSDVVMIIMTL